MMLNKKILTIVAITVSVTTKIKQSFTWKVYHTYFLIYINFIIKSLPRY